MAVVASLVNVVQLIQSTVKIIETVSETYRKVKSQPKQLQQRVLQLSQLRSTLSTLEQQYSTGLTNIERHLRAIFVRINDLKTLFLKLAARQHQKFARRYWKTLIGDSEWNQIQNIFHLLEGDKTALALSILGSQTELSTQIYSEQVERPSLSQVQIESSLNSNLIEADTAVEAPDSSIQKPDHQSSKSASQRGHLEKGREHSENTLRIAELPSPARSMEKTESQMQDSGYSSPINHFGETWKPSAAAEDTITGDKPLGMAPTLAGHAEKASTQSSSSHSGSKYGNCECDEGSFNQAGNVGLPTVNGQPVEDVYTKNHTYGTFKATNKSGNFLGNIYDGGEFFKLFFAQKA